MSNVLVVGSGAREHALLWKLRQSPDAGRLYAAPGNAGTEHIALNVAVNATDIGGIVSLVHDESIDLVVVGPEEPLALGLVDALKAGGHAAVGPTAAAARIEASKSFAKSVMRRAGVPMAASVTFERYGDATTYLRGAEYPVVVKADGLAAGKGVTVCDDLPQAIATVEALMRDRVLGSSGDRIIVEEALQGTELSLMAMCDGRRAIALPVARDYKRLVDGELGPNTGGMGAYAPVPDVDDATRDKLMAATVLPVLEMLSFMGTPFSGILFAGLMLTADGPRVLEFNCRPGDPETQAILPTMDGDLLPYLQGIASGTLPSTVFGHKSCAVGVVLASFGYPTVPHVGVPIKGLDSLPDGVLAFHGGTTRDARGQVMTAGGRVVTLVGTGSDLDEAAAHAYEATVSFEGMQRRLDIGRGIPVGGPHIPTVISS